jgi:hypothetical protein
MKAAQEAKGKVASEPDAVETDKGSPRRPKKRRRIYHEPAEAKLAPEVERRIREGPSKFVYSGDGAWRGVKTEFEVKQEPVSLQDLLDQGLLLVPFTGRYVCSNASMTSTQPTA